MAPEATKGGGDSPLGGHDLLGASTGYMSDLRGEWPEAVARAREVSSAAVELSVLSETELASLRDYLAARPSLPFRYLSVHGPAKHRVLAEDDLVAALRELGERVDTIVMHPSTIEEPDRYRALGRKLALENLDARAKGGRTPGELEGVLAALPEAGLCLDVPHAWSLAPDMSVAHELLDTFGDRLRQLHLSSFSADLEHIPLTEEQEELFRPVLRRCAHVPWILEAPPRAG